VVCLVFNNCIERARDVFLIWEGFVELGESMASDRLDEDEWKSLGKIYKKTDIPI
jgi:hypothetical protein